MNRIPESTIERILAGTDIVELIRSYIPEMKKAGVNYKCICPFHDDKDIENILNNAEKMKKNTEISERILQIIEFVKSNPL